MSYHADRLQRAQARAAQPRCMYGEIALVVPQLPAASRAYRDLQLQLNQEGIGPNEVLYCKMFTVTKLYSYELPFRLVAASSLCLELSRRFADLWIGTNIRHSCLV
ncbi:unnamed protein product [Arctia plantaginis]|uniref:Uncharacterized protein n=1 Tax=Arctia plantaginis TaxID=874455 RepID=A0A8S1AL73_ARCPL|nr:unnamed protein product [Arctia plantaginis]